MSEVLTAPRVITGDQTLTDGAVVIGDHAVDLRLLTEATRRRQA
jgi:hypothetical protein